MNKYLKGVIASVGLSMGASGVANANQNEVLVEDCDLDQTTYTTPYKNSGHFSMDQRKAHFDLRQEVAQNAIKNYREANPDVEFENISVNLSGGSFQLSPDMSEVTYEGFACKVNAEQAKAVDEANAREVQIKEGMRENFDPSHEIYIKGLTAHKLNTDMREAIAAQQCGMDFSEDNVLHVLTIDELKAAHEYSMEHLDDVHGMSVDDLTKLASIQCNKNFPHEMVENVQQKIERKAGVKHSIEHGYDYDKVQKNLPADPTIPYEDRVEMASEFMDDGMDR